MNRRTDATEDKIVNDTAEAIFDRFKAEGRKVEAVVTVVLFKTPGDMRDFHVAQYIGDEVNGAEADELFCECATRLYDAAVEVALKHQQS